MIRLKSLLFEQQATYTLYVDMGGVLFKKMSADAGGSGDSTEYIGEALWEKIKNLSPIILSAVSSKDKEKIKIDQINQYLKPTPKAIFVSSGTTKRSKATPTAILIDDDIKNINAWESKGADGIGILHDSNNVQSTIDQLKKYFDLD